MDQTQQLKTEIEKLKQINENKSDIISVTSHQLRTSLSALKWILKMLIDEDAGKLTAEQRELLEKSYTSNERMLNLVNDLLTLNHSDDIGLAYKLEKIDLINLIEQTLFEFHGETKQKGIELIFLKPLNPIPPITCDQEMMRVVIQNLVENSIKYSNLRGKIFITLTQKENEIQLSIYDTGIKIEPADKENIFKKFFRSPNAKAKDVIGSGLGLFTTKNIVEKHHGKIWFENTDNGGTTFFVTLPIV